MLGTVILPGQSLCPEGSYYSKSKGECKVSCKPGQDYTSQKGCFWPDKEVSSRPPEVTAVLDEHVTPPPAIISTPTVVPAEELILGMPKKTAKIVGGVTAGLFLLLLFR